MIYLGYETEMFQLGRHVTIYSKYDFDWSDDPCNLPMALPVLSSVNNSVDVLTLAVIVGATSFGTVLGVSFVYWLLQLDLPAKLQAAIITFILVTAISSQLFFKRTQKRNFTPKDVRLMTKVQSGHHLLESKYIASTEDYPDPYSQAVSERNKLLGLVEFNDENLKEEFYKSVYGKCCESVIGSVWLPVGVVGPIPLIRNSEEIRNVYVPLATVEGALVASVNRGCKALRKSFETDSTSLSCIVSNEARKGMTRGPSFRANSIESAAAFLAALHDPKRFDEWAKLFDSSSPGGHVKLSEIRGRQLGNMVYVRIRCDTSEAMGMNMISRGCQVLFETILSRKEFKEIRMESISGNFCVDKKPAAINWIEGRGREVIVSARIPRAIMKEVFGIYDLESLEKLNFSKNILGSAAAGSIGGLNAHVANVVAAVYLSTGQDVAQVVDASQSVTLIEFDRERDEIFASLTMPCIEIGVRGGGTGLPHQNYYLKMIIGEELNGSESVDELAKCIGLVSLAGELSLLASLQAGTLVSSHFKLNH